MFYKNILCLGCLLVIFVTLGAGWGRQDKVLLKDIQTLTLHHGEMTNGRRSRPVSQIDCVGGSAYGLYHPKVVQCYNRGWDGNEIQWECKADMDSSYRFGRIAVSCEGYDHPDDPYILKGSCGLEYELDLTEEGRAKKGHSYNYSGSQSGSGFATFVFIVIVVVIVICVCSKCKKHHQRQEHYRQQHRGPPPPGFRPEFMPDAGGAGPSKASAPPPEYPEGPPPPYPGTGEDNSQFTHASTGGYSTGATSQPSSGGGFWTGAATGAALGYVFGRGSRARHRHTNYGNTGWGWGNSGGSDWGGNNWGQSSRSNRSSDNTNSSSSSNSRTASGFGGTKRR